MTTTLDTMAARRIHVTGVVQGVGFRPFVYRLATTLGLTGWVRNESGEVQIHVEGRVEAVGRFVDALRSEAPPSARIGHVEAEPATVEDRTTFTVAPSTTTDGRQPIAPDSAICAACEAELLDPSNRRYRYPFITCTDCGPRFTIIDTLPYDRDRTSMRTFAQCAHCLEEYQSPGDRRYHSETNSCPACGPRIELHVPGLDEHVRETDTVLRRCVELLDAGRTLAIRGLGGFHLATDATSEAAVQRLRARKYREAKPLAVMVRDAGAARLLAHLSDDDCALLESPARPIVILPRRQGSPLATSVAPGLDSIGVVIAYTPLHILLLEAANRPLVMTSGNRSDEPIAIANADAFDRLADISDAFVLHDREILARYDDSVVRPTGAGPIVVRRARGYAPLPLRLPIPTPVPLVAVGPHLKNTFTLVHGDLAFVSQHIGDLDTIETLEHFHDALAATQRQFSIEPQAVVHDLHPGYMSSEVAVRLGLEPRVPVQHHHAHVAAVLAEHGRTGPVLGVAFDGVGLGVDGHVWGAEILVADLSGFERLVHLRYAPLPGGDRAARMPWRSALGYQSLDTDAPFGLAYEGVDVGERHAATWQLDKRFNAPLASSMGRLFDAAAAIIGLRRRSHYEGQAAMELEATAGRRPGSHIPLPVTDEAGPPWQWDPIHLLSELGAQALKGANRRDLAAAFHDSIAAGTVAGLVRAREHTGLTSVALGGGVFQNARLVTTLSETLNAAGFDVLLPHALSPNDGAISFGQAAIGAAQLRKES